jgi:hypothetical protein
VNDNMLSGSLPLELINLTVMDYFWFHNTALCEPADPDFQAWLASIPDVQSTGAICEQLLYYYLPIVVAGA